MFNSMEECMDKVNMEPKDMVDLQNKEELQDERENPCWDPQEDTRQGRLKCYTEDVSACYCITKALEEFWKYTDNIIVNKHH